MTPPRLARPLLLPLTPLFRAAVAAKNLAYRSGCIQPRRLVWPVVSVGSLAVGGAGKTPFVIRLAELLRAEGVRVDVLSRGYGRIHKTTERVDPAGTPQRFGDEPLLIARTTDVPVFVGDSRFRAGLLAEQVAGDPGLHILDDGFQHRQLGRSWEIVLVNQCDLDDSLLPAGNLREPLSALDRASVFVVRAEERDLVGRLRERGLQQPVWVVNRRLVVPVGALRPLAFCGIARPSDFFAGVTAQIEAQGGTVVSCHAFRDHHRYLPADMERLARAAEASRADAFLTTEKDEVKLNGDLRSVLEQVAPVRVCRLGVMLEDETATIKTLIMQLGLKPIAPVV